MLSSYLMFVKKYFIFIIFDRDVSGGKQKKKKKKIIENNKNNVNNMLLLLFFPLLTMSMCPPCDDEGHSNNDVGCCVANICLTSTPPLEGLLTNCLGKSTGDNCDIWCENGLLNISTTLTCRDDGTFIMNDDFSCVLKTCESFSDCTEQPNQQLVSNPEQTICDNQTCDKLQCCESKCLYRMTSSDCLSDGFCEIKDSSPVDFDNVTCVESHCSSDFNPRDTCSGSCYYDVNIDHCVSHCSSYSEPWMCIFASPCTWSQNTCHNTVELCSSKSEQECYDDRTICSWQQYSNSCSEIKQCPQLSMNDCYKSSNCMWNIPLNNCAVIPYCSGLVTLSECESVAGCVFNKLTGGGCQPPGVYGPAVRLIVEIKSSEKIKSETHSFCRLLETTMSIPPGTVNTLSSLIDSSSDRHVKTQNDESVKAVITLQFKGPRKGYEKLLVEGTQNPPFGWIYLSIPTIRGPAIMVSDTIIDNTTPEPVIPAVGMPQEVESLTPTVMDIPAGAYNYYFLLFFISGSVAVLAIILLLGRYRDICCPEVLVIKPNADIPLNHRRSCSEDVLYYAGWYCPPHELCWTRLGGSVIPPLVKVISNPVDIAFPRGSTAPKIPIAPKTVTKIKTITSSIVIKSLSSVQTPDDYQATTVSVSSSSTMCGPTPLGSGSVKKVIFTAPTPSSPLGSSATKIPLAGGSFNSSPTLHGTGRVVTPTPTSPLGSSATKIPLAGGSFNSSPTLHGTGRVVTPTPTSPLGSSAAKLPLPGGGFNSSRTLHSSSRIVTPTPSSPLGSSATKPPLAGGSFNSSPTLCDTSRVVSFNTPLADVHVERSLNWEKI